MIFFLAAGRLNLVCLFLFVGLLAGEARADLLHLLAPDALVVAGDAAPLPEAGAAQKLAVALRAAGGPPGNLVKASQVNTDLELAASHHLLVVGTVASNAVMARIPSHWALNRDEFYASHAPFESYMPTKGFFAAGYGSFTAGDVGYEEWDRNPYWHYATNLHAGGSLDNGEPIAPDLAYRQMARFTGNSPAGVAAAVDAFLNRRILTGAIAARDLMMGAQTLWSLDSAHFAAPEKAPPWIPAQDLSGGGLALTFAGWHIADAMTYSGFLDAAGVPAAQIWRAKYLTEKGWNLPMTVAIDPSHPMTRSPLFEASLARRASDNEWFVARLSSAADAQRAAAALEATLTKRGEQTHAPWSDETVAGVAWRRSRFGVHLTAFHEFVTMESFDAAHDALALGAISQKVAAKP